MPIFKDTKQLYDVLGEVFNFVLKETELGTKMREYDVTLKFIVKEPEGFIWIGPDEFLTGNDANKEGIITMELSADSAHQFWMKQLNLPLALATRKIKSKGPIPKVLKILPFLKPVYSKYPEVAKKHDLKI